MARARNPWLRLGWDSWALGLEASSVIGLRLVKIAAGGAEGEAESRRMVTEKVDAGLALQTAALTGGLGLTPLSYAAGTVSHYRRKVRANRRRLKKG